MMVESPDSARVVAEPTPTLADLPLPRRVAIATLFRQARRTARDLAALYAAFAQRTPMPELRAAVDQLATLTRAHAAAVSALAPVLDPDGSESPAVGSAESPVGDRADLFARATDDERVLEADYREIGALLGDPARCPGLQRLVAEAARHHALLRDLYLRYS